MDIKLVRRYPNIEAVYPFSLDCLYSSVYVDASASAGVSSTALVKGLSFADVSLQMGLQP